MSLPKQGKLRELSGEKDMVDRLGRHGPFKSCLGSPAVLSAEVWSFIAKTSQSLSEMAILVETGMAPQAANVTHLSRSSSRTAEELLVERLGFAAGYLHQGQLILAQGELGVCVTLAERSLLNPDLTEQLTQLRDQVDEQARAVAHRAVRPPQIAEEG